MSISFLYQTLFVFSQIKDRKHIGQNFHSVAGIMHQGCDLGVLGGGGGGGVGSKTLAWRFAMARSSYFFNAVFREMHTTY